MVGISWLYEKLGKTPRQSVLDGRHGTDVLFKHQINLPPAVGGLHQITQNNSKGVNTVNVINLTFFISCFHVHRIENKVFMKDIFQSL